ncbi:FGGY-family carbohydrate kinase [Salinisphaera sp. SWV1]|uniref:FGGY-family carbohydrate kinase n=1 Tax=Salinisphaera sp. SWV1 TaxID=3454139 RepID=UPI003F87F67F
MSLFLGVDFGTGGVRVGLYDVQQRRLENVAEAAYDTDYPGQGRAEQAPDDWWQALGRACRALMSAAGRPAVVAMSVATTASTVVAARENGRPVRPALLWMDCRASVEATETAAIDHPMMCPGGDAAEWLIPKAMWMARHERDLYCQSDRLCEAVDWINHALTGRWVASRLNATCKWNYDSKRCRFPADLYEQLDVPELIDKLPGEVFAVGEAVGEITAEAAAHLGLNGRPLLVQGGIDAHVGMLGAGATEPGDVLFIGGTSNVQLIHTEAEQPVTGVWGPYADALVDDSWLLEGGQISSGSILSWLAHTIFGLDDAGHSALIAEAGKLTPADSGLLVLDYWMGNRSPYRDANLRGAIFGLSLHHGRVDMYRAAVEAVALGAANVFTALARHDISVRRVIAAGGFQKNPLWLETTVNATGLPFDLVPRNNLTLIGTAAAAACGGRYFASLREAAAYVAEPCERVEPDRTAHRRYADLLGRYQETTERMGDLLCSARIPPTSNRSVA